MESNVRINKMTDKGVKKIVEKKGCKVKVKARQRENKREKEHESIVGDSGEMIRTWPWGINGRREKTEVQLEKK